MESLPELLLCHLRQGGHGLVAELAEVVGEGLDGLCRVAGHHVLAVVGDKDGLFGPGDADALLALRREREYVSESRYLSGAGIGGRREGYSYLAGVYGLVLDSCGHVALADDVDALRVGLDDGRTVLLVLLVEEGNDRLKLGTGGLQPAVC